MGDFLQDLEACVVRITPYVSRNLAYLVWVELNICSFTNTFSIDSDTYVHSRPFHTSMSHKFVFVANKKVVFHLPKVLYNGDMSPTKLTDCDSVKIARILNTG